MPVNHPPREPRRSVVERRAPRQARALHTLDVILESTAQVVRLEGEAGFSTNRIAARAGVSIGTLYQYVPDKAALLDHWVARWHASTAREIDMVIAKSLSDPNGRPIPVEDMVRALVRPVLFHFATSPEQRELIRLAWKHDGTERIIEGLRRIAERLGLQLQPWAAAHGFAIAPEHIYLATRTVVGTVRFASLDRSPMLNSPAFEDGLTRVAVAALLPPTRCSQGLLPGACP